MSHLAEVYAKDLGVKIGEPIFKAHYYPIMEENYITIHNDNKVQAKEYSYWEEVIILVKKQLPDIKFIQIGNGKEPRVKNVDKFIATNSIKQSAYIIKNSIMHIGTDSLPVHIASSFNKPLVAIYGHTLPATCCPLWGDKNKHVLIESHRNGNKPSYSLKENPKNIDLIKPEEIANGVLKLLGKEECDRETLYVGQKYKDAIIHVVPDHKYSLSNKNLVIRLDLLHKEENIIHLLQSNRSSILTNKPLSDEVLSQKNIDNISYFSNDFDSDFISRAKAKGVNLRLYCEDEKNLAKLRVKFFDHQIISYSKSKKIEQAKGLVSLDGENFKIKSYSVYMKDQKVIQSFYELNDKKNLDDIFIDLDHLMIYKESNE